MKKELTTKQIQKKLKSIICKAVINVTKKHIEEGDPGESSSCPVALGTKEKFLQVLKDHVEIDEFSVNDTEMEAKILWNDRRVEIAADVPKPIGRFINEVDRDLREEEETQADKKLKPVKFKYQRVMVEVYE
jgi:hypothetical protein